MERMRRLGNQWTFGAAALFLLVVGAMGFGSFGLVVVWAITALAGGDQDHMNGWLAISAIVWLPLSVGVILPGIAREFAPRIREIEESKRKAELAPYLKASSKKGAAGR